MSTHERAHHDEANNVTYQRCQFAYKYAVPYIKNKKVLDVGCGNAYGTAEMASEAQSIVGIDYDLQTIEANKKTYSLIKNISFINAAIPPLPFEDSSFDVITSFQFIEHIHQRSQFLSECMRVIKPGGKILVTTPNRKKSMAKNPFHVHEYTFDEMLDEASSASSKFILQGLNGNQLVNDYYIENGKFVRNILKWDVLKLHRLIPSSLLSKPYNWITNLMRNKLKEKVSQTSAITTDDFFLQQEKLDDTWDIYLILEK